MRRFEEHITINVPAEKVWEFVSDFTRHGEFSGHGLQVTKQGDGPAGVGARYSTVAKQFGTQREESTIADFTPSKKFAWDSTGALGKIHHWFTLREDAGSTMLMKGLELVEPKFLAKMMGFKISRDTPKALKADLEKVKSVVEGSAR